MAKAMNVVPLERFASVKRALESAIKSKEKIREKTEEIVENGIRTAEIGAGAYAFGAVEGYFGPVAPFGVPVELAVGVGGHALAMIVGGKSAPHVRNVADAGIGVFGYKQGLEAGKKFGKAADKQNTPAGTTALPSAPSVSGDLPSTGTTGALSPEDRAAVEAAASAAVK